MHAEPYVTLNQWSLRDEQLFMTLDSYGNEE